MKNEIDSFFHETIPNILYVLLIVKVALLFEIYTFELLWKRLFHYPVYFPKGQYKKKRP